MNTIYGIKNKKSGKIVYVGCTNNFWTRLSHHRVRTYLKTDEHYNQPLYAAIRKYGFDYFSVVQLDEVNDRTKALKREAELIRTMQPTFNKQHKKVK